jgi:hypothetical protein
VNTIPKLNPNPNPKPKIISFWYLLPFALGVHGLILGIPIALDDPKQKPPTAPVKVQKLPGVTVPTTPKSSALPSPAPSSSLTPIANPVTQPVTQPSTPSQPSPVQPSPAQPNPVQSTPVQPQPSTNPATVQPPSQTRDVFQIQGTTPCENVKDCYASTETNGRSVTQNLEQVLREQGYELKEYDLEEDTGMKIYKLFLNGAPKDYLHIIWSEKGTRSLRLPNPEKDRDRLASIAKL